MNVIVFVECFKTLMRRKSKYLFNGRTPLPKNWIRSCQYSPHCCLELKHCIFLGSNLRPLEITFRFPSHPSVDLFKRLPQRTDCGTASSLNKPIHAFTRLQHFFPKQCKPCVSFVFCFFFKDRSQQELSQKTRTEILSAPECLQAHTIHHAVRWSQVMNDNLPTCDRGTDLVENDLGNAQYIQFPIALLFQTS